MVKVAKRKLKNEESTEPAESPASDLKIGKKPAKLAKKSKDVEEPAEATSTSKIAKKPSRFPRKSDAKDQDAPSCVVKLGHIPYGFFEEEMLKYFTQFGKVRRIRVARNKKTGNHKGWAYVEFTSPQVAQIAAETMNGYLMFEKRLYCKVLKKSEIPKCILKGKIILQRPSKYATSRRHTKIASAPKTEDQLKAAETRLHSRLKKKKEQLAALGLDYTFEVEPAKTAKVQKRAA